MCVTFLEKEEEENKIKINLIRRIVALLVRIVACWLPILGFLECWLILIISVHKVHFGRCHSLCWWASLQNISIDNIKTLFKKAYVNMNRPSSWSGWDRRCEVG